jgi:hypothetical protein
MRRAAKKDTNHNLIANALRDVGYRVAETHQLGSGFPDLTIAGVNRTTGQPCIWLIEVKDKTGKLTPDEQTFHAEWVGYVHIVRTIDEAYRLVGVL